MQAKFEMSIMEELKVLLGSQFDNIQKFSHSAEVEYVSESLCSTQMLWMKHQPKIYQILESNIPIPCANTAAISLNKNSMRQSKEEMKF